MSMPESFQSRSFRLSLDLLKLYRVLRALVDLPRHFPDQMLRAGTAIGANLAEAKSAYSRRDLAARYTISLRECRECHYWLLLIAADQPHLADRLAEPIEECNQIVAILTTTVRKLRIASMVAVAVAVGVLFLLLTSGL